MIIALLIGIALGLRTTMNSKVNFSCQLHAVYAIPGVLLGCRDIVAAVASVSVNFSVQSVIAGVSARGKTI